MKKTPINKRIAILTEFWQEYYEDEDWLDVMRYADLALPLCHAIHNGIVKFTPQAEKLIDEVWEMVVEIDYGFNNLKEVKAKNAFTK